MTQKVSSADKVKILFLETKVVELEGKLEDLKPDPTFHDSDVMGGLLEEPAQINTSVIDDPKEIDSLRLELKRANEDLSSKEYTIECMEKGIESSDSIYKRELDIRSSERLKLVEENRSLRDQLALKKELRGASHNEVDLSLPPMNNLSQSSALSSQSISVGGAEAVSLPATAPNIVSSLMSPIIIYPILTLLLVAIIWIVVGKKLWNIWKKSNQYFSHERYENRPGIIPNRLLHKYWR